jgi:N-terminal acetyltransferase B complex catalytic subunit
MTTIRRFVCDDLFRFNNVNLDPLTETVRAQRKNKTHMRTRMSSFSAPADAAACCAPYTPQYNLPFYLQYLAKWPEYFLFAEGPGGACQGYSASARRGTAA